MMLMELIWFRKRSLFIFLLSLHYNYCQPFSLSLSYTLSHTLSYTLSTFFTSEKGGRERVEVRHKDRDKKCSSASAIVVRRDTHFKLAAVFFLPLRRFFRHLRHLAPPICPNLRSHSPSHLSLSRSLPFSSFSPVPTSTSAARSFSTKSQSY